MTTPSGTISLSDVNAELAYSPTALITMNDSAVRTLAGVGGAGTVITMNDLRGKSNRVAIALSINSPTANYDIYSNRGPTYNPGKSDITLTIAAPAVVYSSSTGSSALTTGSSWNPGDTITIVNQGVILGRGGNGGVGLRADNSQSPPGPKTGTPGGPALNAQFAVSVNNQNRIAGGGGGGGGGGGTTGTGGSGEDTYPIGYGGGGGGGGIGNGTGGAGGIAAFGSVLYNGGTGQSGSLTAAGSGGPSGGGPNSSGGAGGSYGSGGGRGNPLSPYAPGNNQPGFGGNSGAAVSGNPYITWISTGTINGPTS